MWQSFDKALKDNRKIWLENYNPESRTSKIINDALQKIIIKPQLKNAGEKEQPRGQKLPAEKWNHFFFLQYGGTISLQLKRKLKKRANRKPYSHLEKYVLAYHHCDLFLIAIWILMWSTSSVIVNAVLPMLDKRVDIWPRELLSFKKPIHRLDNM